MESITDYVKQNDITVKITKDRGMQIDASQKSPYSPDGWEHHAYRVRLFKWRGGVQSPIFDWKQGTGVTGSPEDRPDEVLDALISDAWSYINARDFEDFASEFGYDPDSRKAEKIYHACGYVAKWLAEFLGDDLERIATEYERL